MTKNNNMLVSVLVLAALAVIASFANLAYQPVEIQTVEKIVEVPVPTQCEECLCDDYVLTKEEFEEKAIEEEAKKLALESVSLDNKDFKEALFDALTDANETIDSYKDITELSFEYEVDGDEVEFTKVKVYYFIDDDEDESYKARFKDFTVEIDNLDYDDEFEDAEVNEDYFNDLEVEKVYEL